MRRKLLLFALFTALLAPLAGCNAIAPVWGREDPVFPLEVGERLARGLRAPLRVIDYARHAPNLEHPEEFNRILRGFLDLPSGT